MRELTQREMYLKSRAELFYLVCTILQDNCAGWHPDPILIAGLIVLDLLGFEKLNSATPEVKAEVQSLLDDTIPICREVMAVGIPFSGRKAN